MFDLIAIGDTVIDSYIPLLNAEIIEKSPGNSRLLALPFGEKVFVEQSVSLVGGNAANNAVSSARLGLKTAIYTNVGDAGDDADDDRIVQKFKKEGVSTRYVIHNKQLPSNHNVILDFKGERTILTHHQPWKFHLPELDRCRWVYLTSLSPSFVDSNLSEQLVNYLERCNPKLVYQPGTFQIKQGLKKNARLLSRCELLIVNFQEAKLLLGYEIADTVPVKKLLGGLADLGPKKVVITDGKEGSYGVEWENYFQMDIFPAKLLEMTGSGDAYATGVVSGLFYGQSLEEAMRWGAANSASVVEQIGPQAGLLTHPQILKKLKENSKIVARQF
jgi:pseudouridine kinase